MYDDYLIHCKIYWIDNTTIDRKNNNKDYCKSNCRWATNKEQANNISSNIYYKWKTLAYWIDKVWINQSTVNNRIHRSWWTIEKALFTPLMNTTKNTLAIEKKLPL